MAFYLEVNKMNVSYKIIHLKPLNTYFAIHSRNQGKKVKLRITESYGWKHNKL
jgi:hypothetical protein